MPEHCHAVLVGPAAFREMPWKNGGGVTTELLVEPPEADLAQGFLWRLSSASVATSGPFSRFPGLDRSLLLLEGEGLDLDHAGHGRSRLLPLGEVAEFDGGWDTQGTLVAGPCQDFNVMSDRARVRHRLTLLRPQAAQALPAAPTLILYCIQGRAELPGLERTLETRHLLRLDGALGAPVIAALEARTALAVVAFWPR